MGRGGGGEVSHLTIQVGAVFFSQSSMPCLALANCLYRRKLPVEFADLTWVKGMICAKYCDMAHITHVYQSSDLSQPKVFHGNTCAHDMNMVSTATVLP